MVKIDEFRYTINLTHEKLAEISNVSVSTVQRFMAGTDISLSKLKKIVNALGYCIVIMKIDEYKKLKNCAELLENPKALATVLLKAISEIY